MTLLFVESVATPLGIIRNGGCTSAHRGLTSVLGVRFMKIDYSVQNVSMSGNGS